MCVPGNIIQVGLESLLDLISTGVVLYRLQAPGALIATHRNEVIEARTSVVLGFSLILLAIVFFVFAIAELINQAYEGLSNAVLEILIALPASVIYLGIGGMQLNMAWVLRLRSLKQDAIISILGALSSVVSVICALINIIMCAVAPAAHSPLSPHAPHTSPALALRPCCPLAVAHVTCLLTLTSSGLGASFLRPRVARSFVYAVEEDAFIALNFTAHNLTDDTGFIVRLLNDSIHYKYWWLDEVFSLLIAAALLMLGWQQLREDYEAGLKFWTKAFWTDPLPPEDHAGVAPLAAADEKGEIPLATESTPLTKGVRKEVPQAQ